MQKDKRINKQPWKPINNRSNEKWNVILKITLATTALFHTWPFINTSGYVSSFAKKDKQQKAGWPTCQNMPYSTIFGHSCEIKNRKNQHLDRIRADFQPKTMNAMEKQLKLCEITLQRWNNTPQHQTQSNVFMDMEFISWILLLSICLFIIEKLIINCYRGSLLDRT